MGCHNELAGQLPSPKGSQVLSPLSLLAKSHQQRTEGPEAETYVLHKDRGSSLPGVLQVEGCQAPTMTTTVTAKVTVHLAHTRYRLTEPPPTPKSHVIGPTTESILQLGKLRL